MSSLPDGQSRGERAGPDTEVRSLTTQLPGAHPMICMPEDAALTRTLEKV